MTDSATPDFAQGIRIGIATALRNFAVAQPGTVLSYDESSQTCSVQPGVHRLLPSIEDNDEDVVEPLPSIQHVPVCWLVGRGIQVKATLEPGDSVLLVACDFDPSGWMRAGSPQPPDDARVHHWSNAVAIPGLVPSQSPFQEPSDAAALASKVDAILHALSGGTPGSGYGASVIAALTTAGLSEPTATTASSILLLDE
jgi:protein gp138